MKIHPITLLILLLIPLSSCTSTTPSPTVVPPTVSPSPAPSLTPTPQPFHGRLFFDLNGSGLPDQAVFTYDPERFVDPRQPFHPDLQIAIDNYLSDNPDIKDGDLITIEEPGLSGYQVCAGSTCVETDQDGKFSIPNLSGSSFLIVKITDPRSVDPAMAMRYINKWEGAVTVPAYTKDVDVATMSTLSLIPGCDVDSASLVCKLDEDTLQVRDQHLNDTNIIPIDDGITVLEGVEKNIGLMEGFLTLPFISDQVPDPMIWNYFDLIGVRLFNDEVTYDSTRDNVRLNYDGSFTDEIHSEEFYRLQNLENISGVSDSHTGLDFLVAIENYVVSGAPTSKVWYTPSGQANLWIIINDEVYDNCYGHMNVLLVEMDQEIYRGQIIGLSGNSGDQWFIPQLHFHVGKSTKDGWYYLDEYRYIVTLDPLPENFWGNPVSLWTSDNNPQFNR